MGFFLFSRIPEGQVGVMAGFRHMQPQEKAIYVALGNDREEGFKTLRWALLKWKFQPISIIILHIDITKDTVDTYCKSIHSSVAILSPRIIIT